MGTLISVKKRFGRTAIAAMYHCKNCEAPFLKASVEIDEIMGVEMLGFVCGGCGKKTELVEDTTLRTSIQHWREGKYE